MSRMAYMAAIPVMAWPTSFVMVLVTVGFIAVVLGAASLAQQLRFELVDLDVRIVENHRWQEGMGSSIRAGLDALAAGLSGPHRTGLLA